MFKTCNRVIFNVSEWHVSCMNIIVSMSMVGIVSSFTPIPTIGCFKIISLLVHLFQVDILIYLHHYVFIRLYGCNMRSVNFKYLTQAYDLLNKQGISISNRRLRRLAYLDVHQSNYRSLALYATYKKIVNSDAANNQIIAIVIVVVLISTALLFISRL